tara:strand:+ start:756 stop:965 length:210 start_codon:yes stop_codon:yes gene_type:complete
LGCAAEESLAAQLDEEQCYVASQGLIESVAAEQVSLDLEQRSSSTVDGCSFDPLVEEPEHAGKDEVADN